MARAPVTILVPGIPQPGGSKRGFVARNTGRVVVTEDNPKSKPWRSVVALCAAEVIRGEMFTGAVAVDVTFFMQRPKGHYGTGRNAGVMKPSAPPYPIVKPDLTKCWRPAEDALKGIAWADDSQVVIQRIRKVYGVPGAQINISEVVE